MMNEKGTTSGVLSQIRERFRAVRKSIDLSRQTGLLVVVCFVGLYGLFRVLSPQSGAVQVKFVENPYSQTMREQSPSEPYSTNPFSGHAYEEALRLRETSALGMAISLSLMSFHARTGQLPRNATEIGRNLSTAKLLPPGIEFSDGELSSELTIFQINYSAKPLSFEVLAIPRFDRGTQLLFKFPLPQSEPNSVLYFEAKREQPIPPPLQTTEQLSGIGWRIRHWRGDPLTLTATTINSLREQSALLDAP